MPCVADWMPRKILPPPTTTQTSAPRSCTDLISAAMRSSTSRSRPYSRSPMSASPDTFSSTRRYFKPALMFRLSWGGLRGADIWRRAAPARQGRGRRPCCSSFSASHRSGDLGGKVILPLLDALAELEAGDAGHLDRRTNLLARGLDRLPHSLLGVDDVDLFEENHFLVELAQAALHHLGDDLGRLARSRGLLGQDLALVVDELRV